MRPAYVAPTRRQKLAARSARMAAMAKQVAAAPKRSAVVGGTCTGVAIPKENVLSSSAYENAVRDLGYCVRCGRVCRPQFAHRDEGKGTGIKTDVREGWAGCGPGPWGQGCHYIVGTSGTLTKAQRRAEDLLLGALTRKAVLARGWWPRKLPFWPENQEKQPLAHVEWTSVAINSGAKP